MIVAHNFLEKDKRDLATLEHVEWKKIKKKKKTLFFCPGANVFHSGM